VAHHLPRRPPLVLLLHPHLLVFFRSRSKSHPHPLPRSVSTSPRSMASIDLDGHCLVEIHQNRVRAGTTEAAGSHVDSIVGVSDRAAQWQSALRRRSRAPPLPPLADLCDCSPASARAPSPCNQARIPCQRARHLRSGPVQRSQLPSEPQQQNSSQMNLVAGGQLPNLAFVFFFTCAFHCLFFQELAFVCNEFCFLVFLT
jgi:hypothetical protein